MRTCHTDWRLKQWTLAQWKTKTELEAKHFEMNMFGSMICLTDKESFTISRDGKIAFRASRGKRALA